mgnify:FL=1
MLDLVPERTGIGLLMSSLAWNLAAAAGVIVILFAAFRQFHFMANSTRLLRILAAAVIVAVVLMVLNLTLPG